MFSAKKSRSLNEKEKQRVLNVFRDLKYDELEGFNFYDAPISEVADYLLNDSDFSYNDTIFVVECFGLTVDEEGYQEVAERQEALEDKLNGLNRHSIQETGTKITNKPKRFGYGFYYGSL